MNIYQVGIIACTPTYSHLIILTILWEESNINSEKRGFYKSAFGVVLHLMSW